jgi:hypothetical protein
MASIPIKGTVVLPFDNPDHNIGTLLRTILI